MKKGLVGILLVSILLLSGCNLGAKSFGGTVTVDLPDNKKLVNVTWKDSSLWYLTKDMTEEDTEETYEFIEKSNTGIKSGKVIIKEHKSK
ncbi:hypothetical protein CVD28_03780 [Bacillus sp. M6-12]|uniref:hypothetical protein n=1 Tax=Bacillus sp. M6-12 TaxID=2054166 RepID=UPI000C75BECE|nr:hypothetical protein [Bacillus sp. M6-12]PLS19547.1 hypothetical protein CVD28_03780 [Bacillus sp. M6-12]